MKEIDGSSVLLLGYGLEGQSTHTYLHNKYPNKSISIADINTTIEPLIKPAYLYLGDDYLAHLSEFDVIVRSPGIPIRTPELQQAITDGKKITSETNIFFDEYPGIIVGITGTKGKSTTSSLIASILSQMYQDVRLVGNIGTPALDQLSHATKDSIFVAELSSYQLEDIRFSPKYAVMLGLEEEHINYHGSFNAYKRAKRRIVEFQDEEGYVIFNALNISSSSLVSETKSHQITFSSTKDYRQISTYIKNGKIYYRKISNEKVKEIEILDITDITLLGKGNIENVLAAVTVGMLLNVSPDLIKKAVTEFQPLAHRLEYIGNKNDIRFYNDSLATIPKATINALEALSPNVETLIAGGFDRGISFEELGQFLAAYDLKNLILFPTTGEKIWQALVSNKKNLNLPNKFNVSTMEEAVTIALRNTSKGKVCLLSPASPSFGVFKDYADRGNQFKDQVKLNS